MKTEITPFLAAARARGCAFQVGTDMLFEKIPAYLEFFGLPTTTADEPPRARTDRILTPPVPQTKPTGRETMTAATFHEPAGRHQSKKAAASGWIGSALEYYDFFIYATAAALIFPQIFFPVGEPAGRDHRLARDLRRRLRRAADRRLRARPLGRHPRPQEGADPLHVPDGHLDAWLVGLLPTYEQVGLLAPALLVILRLVQGFAVAGEISGASSMILEHAPFGRRGFFASFTLQGVQAGQILAAAVFLPLAHFMPDEAFNSWGWRIPFLLSFVVIIAGYDHPPRGRRDAGLRRGGRATTPCRARRSIEAFQHQLARHDPRRLHGADEHHPGGHHDLRRGLRGAAGLRHRLPQGRLPVDPGARQHPRGGRHPVRRQPVATRSAAGRRSSSARSARACSSFGYLYAISIHNVPLAIVMSLLMWGVVYQGYNAVFPSFYPELFPTRIRVSAMAISQNVGTTITALLPALFAAVAPPGSTNIPMTIGAIAFGITVHRRDRRLVGPRDLPGAT